MFGFIQRYIEEHRRSPFIREIQLGCQIASYKSAIDRLNALERKGFIKRTPNKHRGIRIVSKPPQTVAGAAERAAPQVQEERAAPLEAVS